MATCNHYLYLPASAQSSRRAIETSSYTTTPSRSPRSSTPAPCGEHTYSYQPPLMRTAASAATAAAGFSLETKAKKVRPETSAEAATDSESTGTNAPPNTVLMASSPAATSTDTGTSKTMAGEESGLDVVDMALRAHELEMLKSMGEEQRTSIPLQSGQGLNHSHRPV